MKHKMMVLTLAVMMILSSFALPNVAQAAANPALENAILASVLVVISDEAGNAISYGSGSVIDSDGLILTNYHVVGDNPRQDGQLIVFVPQTTRADEYTAMLAQTIDSDPVLDLALVRIVGTAKGQPLSPDELSMSFVNLGDSDQLQVGENVYAIGYPDIASSQLVVTRGMVSGFLKDGDSEWILSDVVTSQGNSGGLLINEQGELVGVPTVIRVGEDSQATMSYLRPINDALPLIQQAEDAPITVPVRRQREDQAIGETGVLHAGEIINIESATVNGRDSRRFQNDLRTLFEDATWILYPDGTVAIEMMAEGEAYTWNGQWEGNEQEGFMVYGNVFEAELYSDRSGAWYLYMVLDLVLDGDEYSAVFYQVVEPEILAADEEDASYAGMGTPKANRQDADTGQSIRVDAGEIVKWITATRNGRTDRSLQRELRTAFEDAVWTLYGDLTFEVVNEDAGLEWVGTWEISEEDGSILLTLEGDTGPFAMIFVGDDGNEYLYFAIQYIDSDGSEIQIELVQLIHASE